MLQLKLETKLNVNAAISLVGLSWNDERNCFVFYFCRIVQGEHNVREIGNERDGEEKRGTGKTRKNA